MINNPTSVRFNSNRLSGAIHYPNQQTNKHPAVIFVHGFVGNKVGAHRLFVKAANHFSKLNYLSFRFDFSGCGESTGDYRDVTLTEQIRELQAAIQYVTSIDGVDSEQIILIGHSLGGAVTTLTAALEPLINHFVLWSPVARPYRDISRITGIKAVEFAKRNGVVDYEGFLLSDTFFSDLKIHHPLEAIATYQGKAYIIHAEHDEDVPVENAIKYSNAIQQRPYADVSYIKDADHTFSNSQWENELFQLSSDWISQRIKNGQKQEII